MNYKKLYFAFIEKFKSQVIEDGLYTEIHHILPRYAGGDDSEENLIRLLYKQHVFVHHLWAKATNDPEAWCAYNLMSGKSSDVRHEISKAGGAKNVKSGHLERIRHLANTPERQRKLQKLNQQKVDSGEIYKMIEMANDAWRGQNHTEEFKENRSKDYKDKFLNNPEYKEAILNMQSMGIQKIKDNSLEFSNKVIENAERNETYLQKVSNKSLNKFISPEGLEFDSPIFASKYYGNVKPHVIENWCKRGQYGWDRKPKTV